jgi:predicted cation transporter
MQPNSLGEAGFTPKQTKTTPFIVLSLFYHFPFHYKNISKNLKLFFKYLSFFSIYLISLLLLLLRESLNKREIINNCFNYNLSI